MSSEMYNYSNSINVLAGLLLVTVGMVGCLFNLLIIFIYYKEKSARTEFNLICAIRAFFSVYILLLCFLFVFSPITLLGRSLFPDYLDSMLINTSLSFYIGNEYQVVLIAINRFLALFFPIFHSKYCGKLPTLLVLLAFYGFRVYSPIYINYFQLPAGQCYTSYSSESLSWNFNVAPQCEFDNAEFVVNFALIVFSSMTMLNCATFLKIVWFYKSEESQRKSKEMKSKARKNAMLFFQTVLQDSLYLIDMTFTYKLGTLSSHRFWSFICGTFVWECLHLLDGFIMIMFNERLSLLSGRFFSAPPSVNVFHSRTL